MKERLLLLIVITIAVGLPCLGQQNKDSIYFSADIEQNPNGFATEEIKIQPLLYGNGLKGKIGIRIVDLRPDTSCIGYVKLKKVNKKITVQNGFVHAVNTQPVMQQVSPVDSIIIYIQSFWLINGQLVKVAADEDYRDIQRTSGPSFPSSCHIRALYFAKHMEGLSFLGQLDTVITSSKPLPKSYHYLPDKAMAILAEKIPHSLGNKENASSEETVWEKLHWQNYLPNANGIPDGVFVSFDDFKNGLTVKRSFNLVPRIGGYKLEFNNERDGAIFYDKCWGICYQNRFYVKRGFLVTPLYKTGGAYITIAGSNSYDEDVPIDRNGWIFQSSKYNKYHYMFTPLLLNPLTGHLE